MSGAAGRGVKATGGRLARRGSWGNAGCNFYGGEIGAGRAQKQKCRGESKKSRPVSGTALRLLAI